MPEVITLSVNGSAIIVPEGSMVSTAVALSGSLKFRRSVSVEARAT